MENRHRVSP